MGKHLALGDRPDAAIAVPESLEDTTVIGVGFEPEVFLQGLDRNHAFNEAMRSCEAEGHAAAPVYHQGFEFESFHDK